MVIADVDPDEYGGASTAAGDDELKAIGEGESTAAGDDESMAIGDGVLLVIGDGE
jgi:hypothetical protein